VVRRFIAGAVCPRCRALDRLVIEFDPQELVADKRICVACGFSETVEGESSTLQPKAGIPRGRVEGGRRQHRPQGASGPQRQPAGRTHRLHLERRQPDHPQHGCHTHQQRERVGGRQGPSHLRGVHLRDQVRPTGHQPRHGHQRHHHPTHAWPHRRLPSGGVARSAGPTRSERSRRRNTVHRPTFCSRT